MSTLTYEGMKHLLTLRDSQERVIGSWQAHNLVDRKATVDFVHDGTYSFQDKVAPHHHPIGDTVDGGYGPYGIFRIIYPGHQGVGVHSGRRFHKPVGPAYWTEGCIRTTDTAMKTIVETVKTDHLSQLLVKGNHKETISEASFWLLKHPPN